MNLDPIHHRFVSVENSLHRFLTTFSFMMISITQYVFFTILCTSITADVGFFEVVKHQWECRECCYWNRGEAEVSIVSFETLPLGFKTSKKPHICQLT